MAFQQALAELRLPATAALRGPLLSAMRQSQLPEPLASLAAGLSVSRQPHRASSTTAASTSGTSQRPKASPASASIDKQEVEKFRALAQEWWSHTGPLCALHALTPARVHFLRDAATHCFRRDVSITHPLRGLSLLDVGCGGGILAEAFARVGAKVHAIDVSEESVGVARAHAAHDSGLTDTLSYECVSAEAVRDRGDRFDIVVASEVIEHVRKPAQFVETLAALREPAGCCVVTTLNRTPESYALAIVAAEQLLGLAPQGAHDWNKFLTPVELAMLFARARLPMQLLAGFEMDVLSGKWHCSGNYGVNYAAMFGPSTGTVP
jgi:2-polyprenyl-6-hydroxyphenyl methylase / 3-demethylubiquinone-9 3-methyltransferase